MNRESKLGGTFSLPGTPLNLYRRGSAKSWLPALSRQELIQAVEGNLRNLGLDVLDVVNLRVGIGGNIASSQRTT